VDWDFEVQVSGQFGRALPLFSISLTEVLWCGQCFTTCKGTGESATWDRVLLSVNDACRPTKLIGVNAFVDCAQIRGLPVILPTVRFVASIGHRNGWHFTGHTQTVTSIALVAQSSGTIRN